MNLLRQAARKAFICHPERFSEGSHANEALKM